jgi:hypothetical protein
MMHRSSGDARCKDQALVCRIFVAASRFDRVLWLCRDRLHASRSPATPRAPTAPTNQVMTTATFAGWRAWTAQAGSLLRFTHDHRNVLSWVLATAPEATPEPSVDPTTAPTVEASEYTTPAGRRVRWATATYLLPDGRFAEVVLTADDTASGEASIVVDGGAIVSASFDEARGVTTWRSTEPGAQEAARAAMSAPAGVPVQRLGKGGIL